MADEHDSPVVLIVEPYQDIAVALHEIVALAHCTPRAAVTLGEPAELLRGGPVAAIVVRMTACSAFAWLRAALAHWPSHVRPMTVALASTDEDMAEAQRLGCQVILREPRQVHRLYDTLRRLSLAPPPRSPEATSPHDHRGGDTGAPQTGHRRPESFETAEGPPSASIGAV